MNELDKEILEAPYRKLQAAEDLSEQNYLMQVYANCYQATYKSKYIPALGHVDRTAIQDIRRMLPDKAAQVIEHYFKMKERWFVEMRHSLEVLKRNLNKVYSDYEQSLGRSPAVKKTEVWCWDKCDECKSSFKRPVDEFKTVCDSCRKNG